MQAHLGDRSLFPALDARAYLAHAAIAPLSSPVADAYRDAVDAATRGGMAAFPDYLAGAEAARTRFAALIGATASEVALVGGTSAGVAAIATALPLAAGDRVVVFEGEFPTNVSAWQAAARAARAAVVFVPLDAFHRSHAEGLAALDAALAPGAALVAVSAVQFQSGLAMPLEAIALRAHAAGARVFVDAIQALGATPLDVREAGIDFLACSTHKWLMGPMGAGFLFVADHARAALEPRAVGWLGHTDFDAFLFEPGELRYDRPLRPDAGAFELGVLNFPGLCAAAASLELLAQLGPAAIWAHVQRYHDRLEPLLVEQGWRSLRSRDPSARSTIASFTPPPGVHVRAVVEHLGAAGFVATGPDGCLRVAPHWPNSLDEIEPFADAVRAAVGVGG